MFTVGNENVFADSSDHPQTYRSTIVRLFIVCSVHVSTRWIGKRSRQLLLEVKHYR